MKNTEIHVSIGIHGKNVLTDKRLVTQCHGQSNIT